MNQYVKGTIFGLVITIGLGIVGYLAVVFYLISQGFDESNEIIDVIRSKNAMYWSMPYTLLVTILGVWLGVRKIDSRVYFVAAIIVLLTALSVTSGPLKIMSIHMNYIPIILGGILGGYAGAKT
jgi:hypothetical protein